MLFKDISGNAVIKHKLIETVKVNRISHAQLFLGQEGCGKLALAIAYAQYISCKNKKDDDACGTCSSCNKYNKLIHPDLHFVFPVTKSTKFTKPVSDDYLKQWREFVLKSNYHSYNDWLEFIGSENAQGGIFTQESQEIIKKLNLKTFESEYKVMIIWMADKMNISAANKLLKMIEEPPQKTLFILITENEGEILTTIRSRNQLIKISRLSDEEIIEALSQKFELSNEILKDISRIANGNMLTAQRLANDAMTDNNNGTSIYFDLFSNLMRNAYSVKIPELLLWIDEVAKLGRERQKFFLEYCQRMIRENFVLNVAKEQSNQLVYLANQELEFSKKFSLFIHKNNVFQLTEELNEAQNNIERNASDKICFLDLSLKFVKYLKIKS